MCTAILWDVGGTLVDFACPFEEHVRRRIRAAAPHLADTPTVERIESSFQGFLAAERNWRAEADVVGAARTWARAMFADHSRLDDETVAALAASLNRYFDLYRPVDGIVGLLRELRGMGLRQVVVSNWPPSLPAFLEHHGLARFFDAIAYSAEDGVHKPERGIYHRALGLAGACCDQVVFIGDNPEWDVDPPRAMGMKAVHFDPRRRFPTVDATTTDQLRRILVRLLER